ncbi:MAG TPA: cell division protein ZapE [Candidatus Sulfotelmatobacter sp.]|jgi:cell division protein ZapE|nr:cell division protein ZapE [Candidatus Sulfotelmatobacter sp.]
MTPLAAYRAALADGSIRPDVAQAMAVEKFESLHKALSSYKPQQGESGWLARFGIGQKMPVTLQWQAGDCVNSAPKQGLYIYGDVGRGKSMLMDLFFAAAPVDAKLRVHFHEFMRDVHASIHRWRQDKSRKESDPIPPLAREIARKSWLLCFDELQVSDIGDAMILGRLFDQLFSLGVVVVTTSNRHPDDLYKDGLQRERFLPFIAEIKSRLDVLELNSERDYRLGRKRGMRVYHSPLCPESDAELVRCFGRLTGGVPAAEDEIHVNGRIWTVPKAADGVAWFHFDDLCRKALGASDYLELATLYHTVIVSGVPTLSPANRDAAKRFVTLIDALYEHKVTFVCSAEAPPQTLYPSGDGAFEFQRTVSRLMEMQSAEYLGREHLT